MEPIVSLDNDAIKDLKQSTGQMWEIGREDKAFAWVAEVLQRHSRGHRFDLRAYLENKFDYYDTDDLVRRLQAQLKRQVNDLDLTHHNHEQDLADLDTIRATQSCLYAIHQDEYVAIYRGSPDTPDVNPIRPLSKDDLFTVIDFVTGCHDDIVLSIK